MTHSRAAPLVRDAETAEMILNQTKQLYIPERVESKVTTKTLDFSAFFRPRNFEEYIGQDEAIYLARIMVAAALNEARALPNIMIAGGYGLGKTTLATLIIQAMGVPLRVYDGYSINKEIPSPGTIVIDEIHNLQPEITDVLNGHIDSGKLSIVGCTTNPGALPLAFRSRFRNLFLEDYRVEDLTKILSLICNRRAIEYTSDGLEFIAQRSRFNARQAITFLQIVFDFMSVQKQSSLTKAIATQTLDKLGVDERGLLPRDKKYLNAVPHDRAVGLSYLVSMLGIDEDTIANEIEPYLMRMGYIDRTSRGRTLIVPI